MCQGLPFRCRTNKNNPSIFTAALAQHQFLVFQAIQNTDHGAGADMHFAADGRSRQRAFFNNGAQADQLGRGDIAVRLQLPGMQGNRARDLAQGPQNS